MTNRFKPGNTTPDPADVISNAWAVWVKNILAGGSAASGTEVYFSPIDFTAVYGTQTTLAINWLTLPVEPITEQFIKVVEYRTNGVAVAYSPDQYQFTYDPATNVLTVANAAFVNTSVFRVEVLAQAKSIEVQGAAAHDLITMVGGHDGALARAIDVNATRQLSTRLDPVTGTEGAAPPTTSRLEVAGVDPATGFVRTPWVDGLHRLHIVMEAGETPVTSTWPCTAAELVGETVYNLAGVVRQANGGAVATMPVIGMILSKPTATTCIVVYLGDLPGLFVGLVPGSWYYADIVNGGITTTVPTIMGGWAVLQAVGYAKTATDFVVDRQPQVVL